MEDLDSFSSYRRSTSSLGFAGEGGTRVSLQVWPFVAET